jgi:GT2 family glycosyltransferase
VNSNLTLVDYPSAVILRDAWSAHLEQASAKAGSHLSFGPPSHQPQLSIVVPLYGRIDFMEFQLNWFNAYLRIRGNQAISMQLIYILDDPTLHDEAESLAKRCSLLYQMPFELVTTEANLGFAGANNLACQFAKAESLLLMNSDVLPARLDSIELMLSEFLTMDKRIGALGAKLIYPSGDLQHLGMEFAHDSSLPGILGSSWLNNHPHKFICHSSSDLPQVGIIEVEAATAGCMLLSRRLFKDLEGFKLCYVTGDFEDSDMCLRIREHGLVIAVHVGATFYHLERQSMGLHADQEEQGLKVVAFNAMTHHEKHSAAIARLKQESGNLSTKKL